MGNIDYHFAFRSFGNGGSHCGDAGIVREYENQCFLGVIDALGHGQKAWEVACIARDFLADNARGDLAATMKALHKKLAGTRGAVAALCRLDIDTGELAHVGTGNICVKIIGSRAFTFVPRDGVLGWIAPTPRLQRRKLHPGDILVMHSDGIREHFDPLECADLFNRGAKDIANGLLCRFGKENDDASCMVLRYLT